MVVDDTFIVGFISWFVFISFCLGILYFGWTSRFTVNPQQPLSNTSEITIPIHLIQKKPIADEYDFEETPSNDQQNIHSRRYLYSRKQSFDAKRKLFLALTDEFTPFEMTPILEGDNEDGDEDESIHENRINAQINKQNDARKRELGYVSRVFDLSKEDIDTTELGRGIFLSTRLIKFPTNSFKKSKLIISERPSQSTSFSSDIDDVDSDGEKREFPDIDLPDEHYYHIQT